MKVAVYSTKPYERPFLETANAGRHELVFLEQPLSLATTPLAKGCEAVAIFTNDEAHQDILEQLTRLGVKALATRAAGYDNIDIEAANRLSLQVARVPEYSPYAIAEHTVGMILALNRKLIQADRQVKEYNFALDQLIGFDLHGKTVGIVGLGKIGRIVAKILHGFGCKLLAYDLEEHPEALAKYEIQRVSLENLYRQSDIVTLHVPYTPETKYLIRKESIALMKPGVMIINTGRGGLLHTEDALEALKAGHIGYLGLDVYEKEKGLFFFDHSKDQVRDAVLDELMSLPNVLLTGHQAFLTHTALTNIADTTLYNLTCFANGEHSPHALTHKKSVS